MSYAEEAHPLTIRIPRIRVRNIRVTQRDEYELELGPENIQEIIYALLPYVSATLEEQALKMTALEKRLDELETQSAEQNRMQRQNAIYEKLSAVLQKQYKDKYVAITYDGQIIASAETDVELLKKLQGVDYPADQVFLHKVGSRTFAGWQ